MNIFFDVQGTLISGGIPRTYARSVFAELAEMGHDIYLWSSAGAGYPRDLVGLVCGCYSKSALPPVAVDYVVDGYPDFAEHYDGYAISAFEDNPEARDL